MSAIGVGARATTLVIGCAGPTIGLIASAGLAIVARARLIPVTGQVEVQLFLNINAITGQTLLTLPTQFRPSVQVTVPAMQNSNSGNNGRFEFRTDGTVVNSFVNSSPSFCGCHVVYTP